MPQLLKVTLFSFWHIDSEIIPKHIEFAHA